MSAQANTAPAAMPVVTMTADSDHTKPAMCRRRAPNTAAIANVWRARSDRYSEIRSSETANLKKVEMFHIGG